MSNQVEWLKSALRDAADGIVILDSEGRAVFANPVANRWASLTAENWQLLRGLANEVDRRPLESRKRRYIVSTGAWTIEVAVSPAQLDPGQTGHIFILRDISQERAVEALKIDFVTRLRREVITPLTILPLYIRLLKQGPADRREEYLDKLEQQNERLAGLLQQLLQVCSILTPRSGEVAEEVDLPAAIQTALDTCQFLLQERPLQVEQPIESILPNIRIRLSRLLTGLTWLLITGLPHIPPDVPAQLRVSLEPTDPTILCLALKPVIPGDWVGEVTNPQNPLWPGLRESIRALERVWIEPDQDGDRLVVSLRVEPGE